MNIILNIHCNINNYININNVFQQHAFINMRIVASIGVKITDYQNILRNFIYSALPAKKKVKSYLFLRTVNII